MKKIFTLLVMLLSASVGAYAQSLKGDLNGDGKLNIADVTYLVNLILQEGQNPDDGGDAKPKQEQVAHLDATARELMSMLPASNFQNIADLKNDLKKTNAVNVEDWMDEVYNKTFETLYSDSHTETQTYNYGSEKYLYIYNYIIRDLRSAYDISQLKGAFVLRNGVWVNTNPNATNLQFTMTDSKGVVWKLVAETSGQVKKVHAYDTDKYRWVYGGNSYNGLTSTTTYNIYTDVEQHIIGIPENVVVTLSQGGTQVMKTTVKTELSDITDMEFDLSEHDLSAVVTTEVNGYKIEVSQAVYYHNDGAIVEAKISKGSTMMLAMGVSGAISGVPSVYVSQLGDKHNLGDANVNNAMVYLDILGKVQFVGTVSDVNALVDTYEKAKKKRSDESAFKAYIAQINVYADLDMYFNYGSTKEADVYMEPFAKTTWDGTRKWEADLVISFDDKSSYSTCVNFFGETNFKGVMDDLKALGEKYQKMFK
jgi:hypothetical protein